MRKTIRNLLTQEILNSKKLKLILKVLQLEIIDHRLRKKFTMLTHLNSIEELMISIKTLRSNQVLTSQMNLQIAIINRIIF